MHFYGSGLAVLLVACSGYDRPTVADATATDAPAWDAPGIDAPAVDAPIDAVPVDACTVLTRLRGGNDPGQQGWDVALQPPASLTYPTPTTTQLTTSSSGSTGGQLLLSLPGAVTLPFTLEVTLRVDAVTSHNHFDAPVAIMGSFTPPFGNSVDRAQMIYVDAGFIGWADDSQRAPLNALDGDFHVYRLEVDAAGTATVRRDGQAVLSRAGYTTTGRIAVGDQTNDVNLDSTITIQQVTTNCR